MFVSIAGTSDMSQTDQGQQYSPVVKKQQVTETVGYLAVLLSGVVTEYIREVVRPYDLRPVQFLILDVCSREEADTVSGIAQILPFAPSAVSRRVEELRAKGLLQTRRSREDRRRVHVEVTEEGHELTAELREKVRARGVNHMAALSDSEKGLLVSLMRKALESVE